MRPLTGIMLTLIALSFACSAQESDPFRFSCKAIDSTSISHKDGVEVRTVRFVDTRKPDSPKEVTAHVYIPDSENPVPAIVFSHSSILANDVTTDLKPFALALARGGVASIILDREIKWKPLDDAANRDVSVGGCAAAWLLDNARLDQKRLMHGGVAMSYHCASHAGNGEVWCGFSHLNFGTIGDAAYHNTESMLSLKGQLRMARFVTSIFKLPLLKPEWLGEIDNDKLMAAK